MKKYMLLLILLLAALSPIIAQDFTNPRVVRFLELNEEEVEELENLQYERQQIIGEAQVELNLIKAQLEKLLFPADANLREIERNMEESLRWKLKTEMANITLRVEARKLLGEERWRKFLRLQREQREKTEENRG